MSGSGTPHMLQHVTHRGHEIERYEHNRKLWDIAETAVSVRINVPTVWPVLMIAAARIAAANRFDDGGPADIRRGGLWVSAPGELSDQALADRLTELACDLIEALPPRVVGYHVDTPVPAPPEGGWGNTLPGYYVRPGDRM